MLLYQNFLIISTSIPHETLFFLKNSKKIKTIDMVFKKEARYGEKFISQIEFKGENITVHRLKNFEGEDLFLAECVWV